MDVRNWCSSGTRTVRLGLYYDELGSVNSTTSTSSGSNKSMWKLLWRKFMKEKRKMFESPVHLQVPYDADTYLQNFDQGLMWDEPDSLSRSFSVRFADPSRIFLNKGVM
uniref:Uncharacterized protein n=1 Tax=Davidia involucrata TaxID=16924 RepID=A0A5B7BEM1_DAVIN